MSLVKVTPLGNDFLVQFMTTDIRKKNELLRIVGAIDPSLRSYDLSLRGWKIASSGMKYLAHYLDELDPDASYQSLYKEEEPEEQPDVKDIGKNMKLPPRKYQKTAMGFAMSKKNAVLVLPCGSGKTPIGIGLYMELVSVGEIDSPGMIVVKASLKKQWQKEVEKFSGLRSVIIRTYADITSSIRNRMKKAAGDEDRLSELEADAETVFVSQFDNADLYILNYETLRDDGRVRQQLHRRKVQFIYADEIHYAKDHTTERAKALYEFADAKYRIGATATPLKKNALDVFGVFRFVNPSLFPKVTAFEREYVVKNSQGWVTGVRNARKLRDTILPQMLVIPKEEIADQLPKLVVLQRTCDLDPVQVEMTEKILKEAETLKEQQAALLIGSQNQLKLKGDPRFLQLNGQIMALQTFAQELADTEQLLHLSESKMAKKYITSAKGEPKIELCLDILEEILESDEKVCIFSRFERMQNILTEAIHKKAKSKGSALHGARIAYVNGSMNTDRRYEEVYSKFRDDPDYKILIMSDAGAEGINLSLCKYAIEFDLADSDATQTQRHGRLERADSVHETVYVYQLIANGSWDEIQQKVIAKKENYDQEIIKGNFKS